MRKATEVGTVTEYREAMLRGASLAWEERWEAAAAAYRRALATRPGEPTAGRQLALALRRAWGATSHAAAPTENSAAALITAGSVDLGQSEVAAKNRMHDVIFGRTANAHVAELAELPRDLVRTVVDGMHAVERDQAAGRFNAALERAYALLQLAPTFLPLHILLADLYTDTCQWQAVREKLEAVESAYASRAVGEAREAAA